VDLLSCKTQKVKLLAVCYNTLAVLHQLLALK